MVRMRETRLRLTDVVVGEVEGVVGHVGNAVNAKVCTSIVGFGL